MPDLSSFGDALQRGFGELPPIAIALTLLAGPTLALVGYRLIGAALRMRVTPEVESAPMWVCHDCRSVNQFRNARCYRCGAAREGVGEIEVILDQPTARPSTFEAPVGSPFAALGAFPQPAAPGTGPGVPVMGDALDPTDAVAVGPGRPGQGVPAEASPEDVGAASGTRKRRP